MQDSNVLIGIIGTAIASALASSGFWAYLQKKSDRKDIRTKLLLGLAHDRLFALCRFYIHEQKFITQEQYEDLRKYLYEPYRAAGGNGIIQHLMEKIDELPIKENESE